MERAGRPPRRWGWETPTELGGSDEAGKGPGVALDSVRAAEPGPVPEEQAPLRVENLGKCSTRPDVVITDNSLRDLIQSSLITVYET